MKSRMKFIVYLFITLVLFVITVYTQQYYGVNFPVDTGVTTLYINDTTDVVSLRFTAQASKQLSAVRVYLTKTPVSAAPTLNIGLYTDSGGLPGTPLASGTTTFAEAGVGNNGIVWVNIPMSVTLTQGTIYHIRIQASDLAGSTVTVRCTTPLASVVPSVGASDTNQNVLDYNITSPNTWTTKNYTPTYFLVYQDNTYEGQPYVGQVGVVSGYTVYGSTWIGLQFQPSSDVTVDRVDLYVKKTGTPADDLYYELRGPNSFSTVIEQGLFAAQTSIGTSYAWVQKTLSSPRTFTAGNTYWIMFKSPNNTDSTPYWPQVATVDPNYQSPYNTATFGGTTMCFARSSDGGVSVTSVQTHRDTVVRFNIYSAPPPDTTPPAAVNNLTAQLGPTAGSVILTWTATGDDGTTGDVTGGAFRIDYDTVEKTWNVNTYQIHIGTSYIAGSAQRYTIVGLTQGQTYYFVLWAADEVPNWSSVSNVAQIYLPPPQDTTPPPTPVLISPSNGELTTNKSPLLDWADVTDPSGVYYWVQLDNENTFSPPLIVDQQNLTQSHYQIATTLSENTTYYWRVKAVDGAGNQSAWTPVYSFVVVPSELPPETTTYWGNQFWVTTVNSFAVYGSTKLSLRFTAQNTGNVSRIYLYLDAPTGTPSSVVYEVGLQTDNNGQPSGTWIVAPGTFTAASGYGYVYVTLPSGVSVSKGNVYHIVVQQQTLDSANYHKFRMGVPYIGRNSVTSVEDVNQKILYNTTGTWDPQTQQPIYIIYYDDGRTEGNSYVSYSSVSTTTYGIWGNVYVGEEIVMDTQRTVYGIEVLVRKQGSPEGALEYELRDVTLGSPGNLIESGIFVTAGDIPDTTNWYWKSRLFSSPRDLAQNSRYRIIFKSPASTGENGNFYFINVPNCAYTGVVYENTTFLGRNAFVVKSTDGGVSYTSSTIRDLTFRFILQAQPQDTTPPPTPSLVAPANGSQITNTTPTLDWTDVTDPSGVTYTVQVSVDENFGSYVVNQANLTSSQFTVTTPLNYNTVYYWRVKAVDGAGNESSWSNIFSFTVVQTGGDTTPPPTPQLSSPLDGTQTTNRRPTLAWNAVSDPSGVSYSLQVAKDNNFVTLVVDETGLSQTQYTFTTDLEVLTTYYWRVKAVDGAGNQSAWSSAWRIIIVVTGGDTTPPDTPTLLSPPNDSQTYNRQPTFDWTDVTDPSGVSYTLQVSLYPTFSLLTVNQQGITQSQYTLTVLLNPEATYYWRVKAVDGAGNSSNWSSVWSIIIISSATDTQNPTINSYTKYENLYMLGNKIVFTAVVTDDTEVSSVVLKFRKKGTLTWSTVDFSKTTGDNYVATVNASSVTISGIEYYIEAKDVFGKKTTVGSSGAPLSINISQTYDTVNPVKVGKVTLPDGNPDDGNVELNIPSGALEKSVYITIIQVNNKDVSPAEEDWIDTTKNAGYPLAVYDFQPSNIVFNKPVQLTLLYLDPDDDGIIDNTDGSSTGVPENEELGIYFYNGKQWEYIGGTKDVSKNVLTANIQRLGRYAIFVKGATEEPQIMKQKVCTPDTPVTFPASFAEVTIVDTKGNKVVTLTRPLGGGKIVWLGNDKNNKKVESGVYIYKAKDDNGKISTGMIIFAK